MRGGAFVAWHSKGKGNATSAAARVAERSLAFRAATLFGFEGLKDHSPKG